MTNEVAAACADQVMVQQRNLRAPVHAPAATGDALAREEDC
jgi:hypothetical protein